ncbi:MAG: hypothetical protein QXD62_01345 [Candidatus Woesearchaeota archaeon]
MVRKIKKFHAMKILILILLNILIFQISCTKKSDLENKRILPDYKNTEGVELIFTKVPTNFFTDSIYDIEYSLRNKLSTNTTVRIWILKPEFVEIKDDSEFTVSKPKVEELEGMSELTPDGGTIDRRIQIGFKEQEFSRNFDIVFNYLYTASFSDNFLICIDFNKYGFTTLQGCKYSNPNILPRGNPLYPKAIEYEINKLNDEEYRIDFTISFNYQRDVSYYGVSNCENIDMQYLSKIPINVTFGESTSTKILNLIADEKIYVSFFHKEVPKNIYKYLIINYTYCVEAKKALNNLMVKKR